MRYGIGMGEIRYRYGCGNVSVYVKQGIDTVIQSIGIGEVRYRACQRVHVLCRLTRSM